MSKDKKEQKYETSHVQMIRNYNIAAGEKSIRDYDTYFMMDYFDLLCHKKLIGNDKIYNKFWNINDGNAQEEWDYKVACKTLSLYKKMDDSEDIFEIKNGMEELSDRPFLGIIQICFEHRAYKTKPDVEETLTVCEEEIMKCVRGNGYQNSSSIDYRIYRSSTSGDFCLVIRSADIKDIFKISVLLKNLEIRHSGEQFRLNTYTNIGIECPITENLQESTLKFKDSILNINCDCKFALRFTAENDFAQKVYSAAKSIKNDEIKIERMRGLFGRYDFLLYLSMRDFAEIYPALCKRKIVGGDVENADQSVDENITLAELLKVGILNNFIKIINERALVPLDENIFHLQETEMSLLSCENKDYSGNAEKANGLDVKKSNHSFIDGMKEFQELKNIFIEERRTFINISRELLEVIHTYAPQGIENDSYVNWKILIKDLKVVFECIKEWKKSYDGLEDKADRKQFREKFFQDLRLDIDAINQFYKLLQNVNAQTWQAPLYEIQTQLDAEKMMIAYREFLYDYFSEYRKYFEEENSVDERHKFYPLVYPDMSIDSACAMVPFLGEGISGTGPRLLVCRVPSFEYYGRMFDMIPWILHEASHYVRTMERERRNKFLVKFILDSISKQIMYKLLNKYSNDFGYYDIGLLEKDILKLITKSVFNAFNKYCVENKKKLGELESDHLETELLEFLYKIFDQDITNVKTNKEVRDIKAIQEALMRYAGELNLLDEMVLISKKDERKLRDAVAACEEGAYVFLAVMKKIHDTYYKNTFQKDPSEEEWRMLRLESVYFEEKLSQNVKELSASGEMRDNEQKRDYLFKMRDLHRLCGTWNKRDRKDEGKEIRNSIWSECISSVREKIDDGFADNKGFLELYRILNMIFRNGELAESDACERIGDEFNILFQEEVYDLVQREVTVYRETCADLYTAAALGFNSFGYCRQIFKTASDAGVENGWEWSEAINIRRFRYVMAVLAAVEFAESGKGNEIVRKMDAVWIPMGNVRDEGRKYCNASLDCAEKKIRGLIGESERKSEAVKYIFENLKSDLKDIFDLFTQEESVEEGLEDSMLAYCLEPENLKDIIEEFRSELERLEDEKNIDLDEEEKTDLKKAWNKLIRIRDEIECIHVELESLRYIMYRIKCFITLLNLVVDEEMVAIDKGEYEHFKELYIIHREVCKEMHGNEVYKVVSEYYNEPQSALDKTHEPMLEDALDFIQTYYYDNRFRIMSNDGTKGTK